MTKLDYDELVAAARAWVGQDPDPETVAEVQSLIDAADVAGLSDRFATRLAFGTAGLRGALGGGPNRMNQLLVRQTAAGLADYVLRVVPDAKARGIVIGFDARHKSDRFACDTARVFAEKGMRALVFPTVVPTPILAFSVLHLGAAVGVQVTASHNPPADNGYKVYWGDGPQIVPPLDTEIAAAIDTVAKSGTAVALAPEDHELIETVPEFVVDAYFLGAAAMDPQTSTASARGSLGIVYTAMHGVGGESLLRLMSAAGFSNVDVVQEQFAPDPNFSTVAFPNPEEPGALDLALDLAQRTNANLVLANDPDADRLGAAIPDPAAPGGWRALRGDEIGWLLGDHLLGATASTEGRRLVCTTLVSSSLLEKMAARHDVEYVETLTGFKWLARAALERPELEHVFSYEEALGYCCGSLVRDKDGLTAALVLADLAANLHDSGSSLVERLGELAAEYGTYSTEQWSLRFDGSAAQEKISALMDRLRTSLPTSVAGVPVVSQRDLATNVPPADVVVLNLGEVGRITVRPSGTEPKCKVYFEVVSRYGSAAVSVRSLKAGMAEILGVANE